jgi:hypothetical protein
MKLPHLLKQGIGLVAGVLLTLVTLTLAGSVMANVERSAPAVQRTAIVQEVTASPPVISYVGRLLDPATGLPKANGSYTVAFSLYDVGSGGAPLWTEIKSVTVANGLFTTLLGDTTPLNLSQFNGQDLFLGITIGSDPEASPRSRVAHTPYAIRAEVAAVADNANLLGGQGPGAFAAVGHAHDGNAIVSGVVAEPHIDPALTRDNEVATIVKANDGAGSGIDADTLDGQNSSAFATINHSHRFLPIAYGFVNSNGTLASGTSNVSSAWTGTRYEITIDGESYFFSSYATLASPTCDNATMDIGSVSGKLLITPRVNNVITQCPFQFVTFKP